MDRDNNTNKLYDDDAYIKRFESVVVACEKNEKGNYETVLEATAFFPEEGGQSCDRGTLDGHEVLNVFIHDGVIYHTTKEPHDVGATVVGEIDFIHRYRNMQHHSGEHIVSGLVHKNLGLTNVGFHLGSTDMTMDYNGELDAEKIEWLELNANKAIYENIEIIAEYPEIDALKTIDYRSKLDLDDKVRIVTIGDYDICACCAPHVKATGEIGIIKIVDFYRYKGGTRVHALCGLDAVRDYIQKHKDLREISVKLSAKLYEVPKGVDRILEENTKLSLKISEQSEKIAELLASKVQNTNGIPVIFEDGIGSSEMRSAANKIVARNGCCAIFCGDDANVYSFIIASDNISAKSILEKMKESFAVKGGGNDKMVQGNISAPQNKIEETIKHIIKI